MSPFSIMDGNLRKSSDSKDQFSVLNFPLSFGSNEQIKSVPVSNSLVSTGQTISITSDEKLAYIVECKGQTKISQNSVENISNDLPSGNYISVVDLNDLKAPKAMYRFPVGENPLSINLDKANKNLIVCSEAYNEEFKIFELDEDGKPIRIIKKPNNFTAGRISHAEWHSSGNFIIYINKDAQEVGIIKVLRDGPTQQIIRLENFGKPVSILGNLTYGTFTPDQKYFLVLDTNHDYLKEPLNKETGKLFVIKFNLEDENSASFLISKIDLGINPHSFTIHPEGTYVVVSNIENSFNLPNTLSTNKGTLSLLKLDLDGTIKNINDTPIKGAFPGGLYFDKNGENLVVSVAQIVSFGYTFGGLKFFKFNPNTKEPFELQQADVYLPSGVHAIKALTKY